VLCDEGTMLQSLLGWMKVILGPEHGCAVAYNRGCSRGLNHFGLGLGFLGKIWVHELAIVSLS